MDPMGVPDDGARAWTPARSNAARASKKSLSGLPVQISLGGTLVCGLICLLSIGSSRSTNTCDAKANTGSPFENIPDDLVINPTNVECMQRALDSLLPVPTTLDAPHIAVLLEPGDYNGIEVHVGYFTTISGVGESPADVKLGNVRIDTVGSNRNDKTTIFWRSVENMETNMTTWSSQGVSFRRILSNSFIHDPPGVNDAAGHGGGSGGFIADSLVREGYGSNFAAGGQQYFVRNLQAAELNNYGTFNTLYLGCSGTYGKQAGDVVYIDQTPVIAEKPYIVKDSLGVWKVVKPTLRNKAHGPTFNSKGDPVDSGLSEIIDFQDIFIAGPGTSARNITEQIRSGKNIVFTPHKHHLDETIVIDRSGVVILGLGLAMLECANQKACVFVGAVDDVRIAGITVVGDVQSINDVWIQVGDPNQRYAGDVAKPTVLSDVHVIVGYYRNNSVRSSVQINNGHVIIDHSWSWRSDIDGAHGESRNGFTMNGDHIKAYGLFSEHHWQYSLAWYGEHGMNYFFQCETPWDAGMGALQDWQQPVGPSNPWRHWPAPNWYMIQPRCLYVHGTVNNFFGVSVGAYSMEGGGCRTWCGCQEIHAMDTHIQIPNAPNVTLLRAVCWKICGGGVRHCINTGQGDTNGQVHTSWCNGTEVPYLGFDGAYTISGVITASECAHLKGVTQEITKTEQSTYI